MTKYSVSYEIDVVPTPVTIEIRCRDIQDLEETYESRKENTQLRKVKKIITKEDEDNQQDIEC